MPSAETRNEAPAGSEQPSTPKLVAASQIQAPAPWKPPIGGSEAAVGPWRHEDRERSRGKGKGDVHDVKGARRQMPNVSLTPRPRDESYERVSSLSNDPPVYNRGKGSQRGSRFRPRTLSSDKGGGKRRRGDETGGSGGSRPVSQRGPREVTAGGRRIAIESPSLGK